MYVPSSKHTYIKLLLSFIALLIHHNDMVFFPYRMIPQYFDEFNSNLLFTAIPISWFLIHYELFTIRYHFH